MHYRALLMAQYNILEGWTQNPKNIITSIIEIYKIENAVPQINVKPVL